MEPKKQKPPFVPFSLLKLLLKGEDFFEFAGDIDEIYRYMIDCKPRWRAKAWYWFRVLESIPGIIMNKIYWRFVMFKNYLKIAVRNIKRHKSHSAINIFGLSMGLACTILIFLFVKDELSYDRFHGNLNSIYRPLTRFHNPDGSVKWQGGAVHVPHGPALKEYFPDVKRYVRVFPQEFIVNIGDLVEEQEITMADAEFFEMFSFPLVQGHAASVLSDYSSIVLSESCAEKYFGDTDPIGKSMTLISGDYRNDFVVSGVAENPPPNSTVTFNLLINFESIRLFGGADSLSNWQTLRMPCKTYIQLFDGKPAKTIEERYPEFAKKYYAANFEREIYSQFKNAPENIYPISFGLQRMRDIHFDPSASGSGSLTPVYILGGIALIILFIAGINFVTLSIGSIVRRMRRPWWIWGK